MSKTLYLHSVKTTLRKLSIHSVVSPWTWILTRILTWILTRILTWILTEGDQHQSTGHNANGDILLEAFLTVTLVHSTLCYSNHQNLLLLFRRVATTVLVNNKLKVETRASWDRACYSGVAVPDSRCLQR